jgi:outer membrane protein OmpA-like peptidoglycan-associated protein
VVGHTDDTGRDAYNMDLSQRRAQSVAGILTAAGVNGNRIVATGRGETQPIAANTTPQGRAQNRRVEILIRPTR